MGEGWKPLNEVLELPVKSTKTSSENSGSSTSIYGTKKKKKEEDSSTKPLAIPDKTIRWICTFSYFGGKILFIILSVIGKGEIEEETLEPNTPWTSFDIFILTLLATVAGMITALVVKFLLFIINKILKRLRS